MNKPTQTLAARLAYRRLSVLDASFLHLERRKTPMHVATLQIYALPPDAPRDFIKRVVQRLRTPKTLARPWSLKLVDSPLSGLAPVMREDPDIDLDYHVRHSALPDPGGERELGELVSRLHGQLLDRSRPLWTCHVIEGLGPSIDPRSGEPPHGGGRFAIYTKVHHALVDGMTGIRLMTRCLGRAPEPGNWSAPWEARDYSASRKPAGKAASAPAAPLRASDWPRVMAQAVKPLFKREPGTAPILRPFEAPPSVLNGPVTAARRVATQQLDLGRVKRLAKRSGASVNDVFLAVCGAALRRHLLASDALPAQSLIAGVPVSLREDSADEAVGNAVGTLMATLGTELSDPRARLEAIRSSMQAAKQHLKSLPPKARGVFTSLTLAPIALVMLSGLGGKIRPAMNVGISNVPGPDGPLYLDQARLEAVYPVSIPLQGLGLNITCISYAGYLNIGFTGARDSLPHLQKLAVYTGEALGELEAALGGVAS